MSRPVWTARRKALLHKKAVGSFSPGKILTGGGDADAEGTFMACPAYHCVCNLGYAGFDHICVLAARLVPVRLTDIS